MELNLKFYKKVYSAFEGMLFYNKLQRQNKINKNTFIIIQRSGDEELTDFGNKYLEEFIKKNSLKDVVILTSDEYKKKLGIRSKNIKRLICSVERMDCLINLYCMYQFTKNILIFAPDKPNTNRLSKLISTDILTKEEAVAVGIYGLNELKRQKIEN